MRSRRDTDDSDARVELSLVVEEVDELHARVGRVRVGLVGGALHAAPLAHAAAPPDDRARHEAVRLRASNEHSAVCALSSQGEHRAQPIQVFSALYSSYSSKYYATEQ